MPFSAGRRIVVIRSHLSSPGSATRTAASFAAAPPTLRTTIALQTTVGSAHVVHLACIRSMQILSTSVGVGRCLARFSVGSCLATVLVHSAAAHPTGDAADVGSSFALLRCRR
jgi:hypothetical protein